MSDPFNLALAFLGLVALLVIAFWFGRQWEAWHSPLAEEARLTAIAIDAVTRLRQLRNPEKDSDVIAAEAKEAADITNLKNLVSSVS